jgi:ubiquinone/menaquinone biosynthesis C-methylase UbiE
VKQATDAVTPYDLVADQYDALVQNGQLIHAIVVPALLELVGLVTGQQVCDLACGPGVVARALAKRGATVVGIDLSARMLAIAAGYEHADPLGIRYLQDDAQTLCRVEDASLDAVVCNLALTDIPDLQATARAITRVVRPGGLFVYALPHPCFQAPGSGWYQAEEHRTVALVRGYFREGAWSSPQQCSGRLGGHHRMLSSLLNTLTSCGLVYEQSVEPQAFLPHKPGYREVPVAFVARHRKGGTR